MGAYTGNAEDTGSEAVTGNAAGLGNVAGKGNVIDCKSGPETDNEVESGRVAGTDKGSDII